MIGTKIQTLNHGCATVVDYKNKENVIIEFDLTGHRKKTTKRVLIRSDRPRITDPLYPSVFGKGCIGVGPHKAHVKGNDTKPYSIWRAMLRRCYYRGSKHHQQSYEGVTVCDAWLNFQTFAEWYATHYPTDDRAYQLDKDVKTGLSDLYSPERCTFVEQDVNLRYRHFVRCKNKAHP